MKKTFNIFIACICMMLGMVSCNNTDDITDDAPTKKGVKITVTGALNTDAANNDGTRMALDGTTLKFTWEEGDQVTVYYDFLGTPFSATLTLKEGDAGKQIGTFEGIWNWEGITPTDVIFNTNPKDVTGFETYQSIELTPEKLKAPYQSGSASGLPILAYGKLEQGTETNVYNFKLDHKLAYIYVKGLKVDNEEVDKCYFSGVKTLSLDLNGNATHKDAYYASTEVGVGDVVAVVPSAGIEITSKTGSKYLSTSVLEAGKYYELDRNVASNTEEFSGPYTISTGIDGKKVYILKGNLNYNTETKKYSISENQWENSGGNARPGSTYKVIDFFNWGTGKNPTESSLDDSKYCPEIQNGNNFAKENDWGTYYGDGNYRTLTFEEWNNILGRKFSDDTNTVMWAFVNLINSKADFVKGFIIFPDALTKAQAEEKLFFKGDYGTDGNMNSPEMAITEENLNALGALFFPNGPLYWTATSQVDDTTGAMVVPKVNVATSTFRTLGAYVRLARDADDMP